MCGDPTPTQLGLTQYESFRVELEVQARVPVGEERGVHGDVELVTPSGVDASFIIHLRFVHVASLIAVSGGSAAGRDGGEGDEGSETV